VDWIRSPVGVGRQPRGSRFGTSQEAHSFFERAGLRQAMQDAGVDADSLRLEFYDEV
jgi:hypothetical protein